MLLYVFLVTFENVCVSTEILDTEYKMIVFVDPCMCGILRETKRALLGEVVAVLQAKCTKYPNKSSNINFCGSLYVYSTCYDIRLMLVFHGRLSLYV